MKSIEIERLYSKRMRTTSFEILKTNFMNSIPCNLKKHSLYWTVKARLIYTYGREPNIFELKQIANIIHTKHSIPISRDVKRSKELLICWMCDNWEIVQNHLRNISNEFMKDPNNIICFSKCSLEKKKKLMNEYLLRDKMIEIENFLKIRFNKKKFKMKELREIAEEICQRTNLKLNRNEKRDKTANLTWFTINWEIIRPIVDNISKSSEKKEEGNEELTKEFFDEKDSLFVQADDFSESEIGEDFLQEFV